METHNQKDNLGEISLDILSALKVLKQTKCQLLKTGSKPVRDIFFTCECDPDQKEPICKDCIDNCHKGHQIINSFETIAVCNCGLKMHERSNITNDKHDTNEKCLFSEWAKISKLNLIYKDTNSGINYCAFCLSFCGKKIITNLNELAENEKASRSNSNSNKINDVDVIEEDDNLNSANAASGILNCECNHENHKSVGKIVKHIFELFYHKSELNELKKYNFEPNSNKKNSLTEASELNSNSIIKSDINTIMNVNANENLIANENINLISDFNKNIKKTNTPKNFNKSTAKNLIKDDKINPNKIMEKLITKFEYFNSLNQNQLINLILNSKRIYQNYFGLFEKYLIFIKDEIETDNFEIDSQVGYTTFSLCLSTLRNMAESIKMTNFTFFNIDELLSERFIFILINKKFDFKNLNVWSTKNNLVYIYYKFVFKKDLAKFPDIKVSELFNLDPLQHLLMISNAYQKDYSYVCNQYLKNSIFLNTCIKKITKLSEIRENNIHKCELLRTVYRILCQLAKWKAFSRENVVNFCNATDELIFRLFEYNRENGVYTPENESNETSNFNNVLKKNFLSSQLKILTKIIKTHIYLIFNYNNDIIFSLLKQNSSSLSKEDLDKINFFISDPEIGRGINKNIIIIMNFVRNLKKFNLKEMHKLLSYINRIHTLAFEYPDNYVLTLRRILDKNKEIYVNLIETDVENGIFTKMEIEEIDFLKLILIETEKLDAIYHRFNTFEDSYEEFLMFFHDKLKEFMQRYGIFNLRIPEVDFNFENFEFEKTEKRQFKDLNYFEERKNTEKKIKIFEKPLRLFGEFDYLLLQSDNASKHDKNANSLKLLLKFKILINKSFYMHTVINGLKTIIQTELSKTRSVNVLVNPNVFVVILRLLYFYIEENIDNCFAILNTNLFGLIKFLDLSQVDLLVNFLTFILVNLRNNNADFGSSKEIIKICKIIHYKLLMHRENLNLMLKFINILKLVSDFPFLNQSHVYDKIRKILKEFYSENKVLIQFKAHLLSLTKTHLAEFSNRNTKENFIMQEKRSLLNSIIINNNGNNNYLGGNLQGTLINTNNNNYSNLQKTNTYNSNNLGSNLNQNSNINDFNSDGININLTDPLDFQQTLIIYTLFLKLVNFIFDGNATLNEEVYLSSILNQPEIQQILGKKDLNIKLRLEILKFFRMIYIDVIIDKQKLKVYRSVIINQISSLSENNDDLLEDNLRYDFFNNLISIKNSNNSSNVNSFPINNNIGKSSNMSFESYIIKFELKNFKEILNSFSSRKKNDQSVLEYFENGILMPLYVFLNKFMSIIYDLKGSEYLNLYEIVVYFLRVKKILVEHFVGAQKDAKIKGKFFKKICFEIKNQQKLFKDVDREATISQIIYDLEILKKKDFEIFNYKQVYDIFQKHFDEFIISNQIKSILDFFKKKDSIYSETKIDKMRKRFKRLDMLNNNFEQNVFSLIIKYENDKSNFQSSSFLSCLDEHNLEYNSNYRYLLIRSIFYFVQDNQYCAIYRKKILGILLKLLQYQTVPIQKEIFLIYDNSHDAINLNFIVDLFFENFISIIFSSSNPSSVNSNEDYFISLLIIKILKYLCEEHYEDFQKVLFMKLKIDYFPKAELFKFNAELSQPVKSSNRENEKKNEINFNNSNSSEENFIDINNNNNNDDSNFENKKFKKIITKANESDQPKIKQATFFELMLCILSKIIIISKWNKIDISKSSNTRSQSKESDFFSDIFFGVIELLIEMIQGTSPQNLENIKLDSRGENNFFYSFLNISKNILYHDDHNSKIVNNARKNIIEFLIAFLEEKSTPNKLVQLIASVINPYSVFEAIIKIMKKNFVMTHKNYKGKEDAYIHFYNLLFFNREMKENFIKVYFEDMEFCLREEFQLANRMFQYVKLLADKFKHEEANILINSKSNEAVLEKKVKIKVEYMQMHLKQIQQNRLSKKKSDKFMNFPNQNQLDAISKVSLNNSKNHNIRHINNLILASQQNQVSSSANLNNNNLIQSSDSNVIQNSEIIAEFLRQDKYFEMFCLDRNNETADYENVNIIAFFESITRTVRVQNGEDQVMVLFTLNPSIPYLSNNTKIDFYENVNRESRYTKLYSLMEYCDYFQMEINYNYNRSKSDKVFVLFNKFNFKFIEFLLFLLLMVINLIMFANYTNKHLTDGLQKGSDIVSGLGIANVLLNAITIVIWFYTKFELYYNIEVKKFCLKHKINSLSDISKYNKYFVISFIETILKKNQTIGFMWNVIFSSIAVSSNQNHYWFALQTLIIVNLSRTLKLLINAVLLKYKQLLACVFSLIIIVFFFSSISFFYMSEDYIEVIQTNQENTCGSFFYCFLTNFNFGIRTDGGVARWLVPIKYYDENNSIRHFIGRYFYEVMFFIVLILILLNIIFGIIIDTFAELSEVQHEMEHDMHEKCFICGESKASLEKKSIDFHAHTEDQHSIWNYVDYLIMLKFVDAQETNAINSYVIEMVNDKKISWFPAAIKSEEDEEQGHGHKH